MLAQPLHPPHLFLGFALELSAEGEVEDGQEDGDEWDELCRPPRLGGSLGWEEPLGWLHRHFMGDTIVGVV
jgi:hypothetical protein